MKLRRRTITFSLLFLGISLLLFTSFYGVSADKLHLRYLISDDTVTVIVKDIEYTTESDGSYVYKIETTDNYIIVPIDDVHIYMNDKEETSTLSYQSIYGNEGEQLYKNLELDVGKELQDRIY